MELSGRKASNATVPGIIVENRRYCKGRHSESCIDFQVRNLDARTSES